jgi:hypothetical protein
MKVFSSTASRIRRIEPYGRRFLEALLAVLERLVDHFLQQRRIGGARNVLDGFALAEEHKGRGGHDPVTVGGERALDDVQLREFDRALILQGVLDEVRLHLPAVDARLTEEHHEHGQLRKLHFLFPSCIIHFQQVHGCTYHSCYARIYLGYGT